MAENEVSQAGEQPQGFKPVADGLSVSLGSVGVDIPADMVITDSTAGVGGTSTIGGLPVTGVVGPDGLQVSTAFARSTPNSDEGIRIFAGADPDGAIVSANYSRDQRFADGTHQSTSFFGAAEQPFDGSGTVVTVGASNVITPGGQSPINSLAADAIYQNGPAGDDWLARGRIVFDGTLMRPFATAALSDEGVGVGVGVEKDFTIPTGRFDIPVIGQLAIAYGNIGQDGPSAPGQLVPSDPVSLAGDRGGVQILAGARLGF